jgi:transcriptional antiterminator NusG
MTADEVLPTADEPAEAPAPEVVADAPDESPPAADAPPAAPEGPPSNKKWYVIKVTSGREESIKAAIERRVKIEGLEEFFGQLVIPVERVTEIKKVKEKRGDKETTKEKRVIKERKKFPGYVMAEVEFNDRILYLFRETSGVGDFVGTAGPLKPPPPMTDNEVRRMLGEDVKDDRKPGKKIIKLDFEKGDKVRIREGAFANMEGEVKEITEPKEAGDSPKVTVEVMIFGRGVPVDLEYWQVDKA